MTSNGTVYKGNLNELLDVMLKEVYLLTKTGESVHKIDALLSMSLDHLSGFVK